MDLSNLQGAADDGSAGEPCPPLQPGVDVARVPTQGGEELVCLYDREDPASSQVVVTSSGLLLASLLDGIRTPSAVRAAFGLRSGASLRPGEVEAFVRELDTANLLDSRKFRERRRRKAQEFRSHPTRAAVHA